MPSSRPVLIVDDSPEDFETTSRALMKADLKNPLVHCCDGEEAISYVSSIGTSPQGHNVDEPALILLDLNMPGTDGHEVLRFIKESQEYNHIPVVILTTSSDEKDIMDCYRAGANSYIQKPVDLASFREAMTRLKEEWLDSDNPY